MVYKVVLMKCAEDDLDRFVSYLLFPRAMSQSPKDLGECREGQIPRQLAAEYLIVKKNEQAAQNLLNDFEATKISLSNVAGSLKLCDNLKLKKLGYRRINFLSHRYFMLYRIENDIVFVDSIFHELQDYESKMS